MTFQIIAQFPIFLSCLNYLNDSFVKGCFFISNPSIPFRYFNLHIANFTLLKLPCFVFTMTFCILWKINVCLLLSFWTCQLHSTPLIMKFSFQDFPSTLAYLHQLYLCLLLI